MRFIRLGKQARPKAVQLTVLMPRSIVGVLRAGMCWSCIPQPSNTSSEEVEQVDTLAFVRLLVAALFGRACFGFARTAERRAAAFDDIDSRRRVTIPRQMRCIS